MTRRVLGLVVLAFLQGLVLLPSLAGQGSLVHARMESVLPSGPGPVEVVVEFDLVPEPGTLEIPLTVLAPGAARVVGLRLGGEGGMVVELHEVRSGYWTGSLPLNSGSRARATESIRLLYSVEGAWGEEGRITLPIPVPMWVPGNPQSDTFLGTVFVPPGLSVMESFPTSVIQRPEGAEGGGYRMSLQSVPSMLILRVVSGEPPLLTRGRILDGIVLLLLLIMGAMGVVYLRGREG